VSPIHDTEKGNPPQGVYWNEEDWQALLKRLPNEWEEQAIKLGGYCQLVCRNEDFAEGEGGKSRRTRSDEGRVVVMPLA
jgi:hypothetical protein